MPNQEQLKKRPATDDRAYVESELKRAAAAVKRRNAGLKQLEDEEKAQTKLKVCSVDT